MAEVKRYDYDYSAHGFAEKADGDLILYSYHDHEVTRLQRARARVIYRWLEHEADYYYAQSKVERYRPSERARYHRWFRWCLDINVRIAAKYLGSES